MSNLRYIAVSLHNARSKKLCNVLVRWRHVFWLSLADVILFSDHVSCNDMFVKILRLCLLILLLLLLWLLL